MNAADVLCYQYEADFHCTPCAIKRFGEQPGSPILHPWIADESIDSEGNTPAPVFGDSEWWDYDESMPQHLRCSDCEGIIDSQPGRGHVEWSPTFEPLRLYLSRNPEKTRLPWEYVGTEENGNSHYREREHGNRIKLNPNGRLGCVHLLAGTRRCSITESDTLTYL